MSHLAAGTKVKYYRNQLERHDGLCQSYEVTETMSKQINQVEKNYKVKGEETIFFIAH